MKVTTLRLPPDLRSALESEAEHIGISLSELIRVKLVQSHTRESQAMDHLTTVLRESIVTRKLTARTLLEQFHQQGPVDKDEFRALMQRFDKEAQAIVDNMRG